MCHLDCTLGELDGFKLCPFQKLQETNSALANSDEFLGELLRRLETDSDQDWSSLDCFPWETLDLC